MAKRVANRGSLVNKAEDGGRGRRRGVAAPADLRCPAPRRACDGRCGEADDDGPESKAKQSSEHGGYAILIHFRSVPRAIFFPFLLPAL